MLSCVVRHGLELAVVTMKLELLTPNPALATNIIRGMNNPRREQCSQTAVLTVMHTRRAEQRLQHFLGAQVQHPMSAARVQKPHARGRVSSALVASCTTFAYTLLCKSGGMDMWLGIRWISADVERFWSVCHTLSATACKRSHIHISY